VEQPGGVARVINHYWSGFARDSEQGQPREHPTQKPIAVMQWCLGFLPDAKTILDPFMGSGTTGVACVNLGRVFTGIELDEGYFNTACRRMEDALSRPRLALDEPKPKQVQEALL
jgi:site-specific DNA-methyltransferase (adenine-specific)